MSGITSKLKTKEIAKMLLKSVTLRVITIQIFQTDVVIEY
jgi:hypothetical protein